MERRLPLAHREAIVKVLIVGGVFLAVSVAYLWYEMRRAPLIDSEAARAALDHAKRTVPAQAPSPSNEECEDWLMADLIESAETYEERAIRAIEAADFALWKTELATSEEER